MLLTDQYIIFIFYRSIIRQKSCTHILYDWSDSGQRQVAGFCECSDEPSGSINYGEFLD
jgi:hypothetical protein